MGRIARIIFFSAVALAVMASSACYFYWRSLRSTPQYSVALLIDAARQDDKKAVGNLVDIDKVVDDFVPQITSSAVELYGRGLPPQTIQNLTVVYDPAAIGRMGMVVEIVARIAHGCPSAMPD